MWPLHLSGSYVNQQSNVTELHPKKKKKKTQNDMIMKKEKIDVIFFTLYTTTYIYIYGIFLVDIIELKC